MAQRDEERQLLAHFRDFDTAPEMIVVPAGTFLMGSPYFEGTSDEHPQHEVTINKPLAVSIFPVSCGEFAAFIEATSHEVAEGAYIWNGQTWVKDLGKSWRDPGFKQGHDHPVVCVRWFDAQAYVAWLRDRSGRKGYRLLSECPS
jgi:formylglycine-generating enzyme required for sulfatase activity